MRRVAALTPERAALLHDLTAASTAPGELAATGVGDTRRDTTIDALLEIMEAALAEWPALQLVVVEDLQWLDSASLRWLDRLCTRLDVLGAGLVVTSRGSASADARVLALLQRRGTSWIPVDPLDEHEVEQLVLRHLQVDDADPALLTLVSERVGGNPLFCQELLDSLLAAGLITTDERGRFRLHDFDRASALMPDSLLGAVGTQLDRIEVGAQLTLKAASVLGQTFDTDLLARIHPTHRTKDDLISELDVLRRDGHLVRAREGRAWRFRHAMLHDAAYERLLHAHRRELHGQALDALAARPDTAPAVLAHHAWAAERTDEALHWSGPAAQAAAGSGSFREVTALLEPRIEYLPPKDPRRADWAVRLGQAAVAVGDHVAARAHLDQALRWTGSGRPSSTAGHLVAIARRLLGLAWRALRPRHRAPDPRATTLARAWEELGYIHYASGETLPGVLAALAMLDLFERSGPGPGLVRARASAALALAILGWTRASRWVEASAGRIAGALREVRPRAYAAWAAAICAAGRADWPRFEDRVQLTRTIAQAHGDRWLLAAVLQTEAAALTLRGDVEGASNAALDQLELAEELGNGLWEAWSLNALGEIALLQGDPALADVHGKRALALLQEVADPTEEVRALAIVARAQVARGQIEALRETAERLEAGLRATGPTAFYLTGALVALVEVARARGGGTRRALRRLRAFARVFPVARPWVRAAAVSPGTTVEFSGVGTPGSGRG